ncbi:MAG: short-chain dehydrogenase [Proteobacteria bacterium SG_bin7]|nr:MAG: short-chain dehydrogenase [Proteobacteria bacterium SG_bin7]
MQKTYLVSGAGSGIGQAVCTELARNHGAKIILMGRNEAKLKQTQELLTNPSLHQTVVADTTDGKQIKEGLQKLNVTDLHGVVVNAGIGGGNTYGKDDRWNEIINTNLTGAYIMASEALPYLRKSKEKFRHILFISSILSEMGVPGYTAYCASKAGLLGLARSMAVEFARENILVNTICPGWVETDMARSGIQALADFQKISFEEAFKQQMGLVPLGKWSQPDEIGAYVSYLVSPKQTSITGQALHINNGALM